MFDQLSERLNAIFDRLSGRGRISESEVNEALREVRVA
ncbi:MAG: signal recognition particle receptor subunit alpha, partial [Candidatus Cybelea sp.]